MTTEYALEYNINSYKDIRSGIDLHMHDLGRDFDIVRGREFRRTNAIHDGKLKKHSKHGLIKPTEQKEIISKSELEKVQHTCLETTIVSYCALEFGVFKQFTLFPGDWNSMSTQHSLGML